MVIFWNFMAFEGINWFFTKLFCSVEYIHSECVMFMHLALMCHCVKKCTSHGSVMYHSDTFY
jgi:hypothetical protein